MFGGRKKRRLQVGEKNGAFMWAKKNGAFMWAKKTVPSCGRKKRCLQNFKNWLFRSLCKHALGLAQL